MKRLLVLILCVFLFSCANPIEVKFIDDVTIVERYSKGEVVDVEKFKDIDGFLGLYYDENYERVYNGEPLEGNTTLYIKKGEPIKVKIDINGSYYVIKVNDGEGLTLDDIEFENKTMLEGLYYDDQYTVKYQGEEIYHDLTLYVKLKDCFNYLVPLINEEIEQIMLSLPEADLQKSSIKQYFGKYENGIIVSMPLIVTLDSILLTFDDIVISNYAYHLVFYSDGKLYYLENAYKQGLISYDEICIFKEIYEARYAGWQ